MLDQVARDADALLGGDPGSALLIDESAITKKLPRRDATVEEVIRQLAVRYAKRPGSPLMQNNSSSRDCRTYRSKVTK